MDIRYDLTLRMEVYDVLAAMHRTSKQRILAFLDQLMANPFIQSDFTEKDEEVFIWRPRSSVNM